METGEFIQGIFIMAIMVVIFIGLFLLLRTLVIWYFKIDEILLELKELNRNIKLLIPKPKETIPPPFPQTPIPFNFPPTTPNASNPNTPTTTPDHKSNFPDPPPVGRGE